MKRLFTFFTLLCFVPLPTLADDWSSYRITIRNATAQQVITPPLLIVHARHFRLFEVTEVASEGLFTLAETGNNQLLNLEVSQDRRVLSTLASAQPIPYGQSASFDIDAPSKARLSLAGMLATTNDAFMALNGVPLPKRSVQFFAHAYDAGSELNNESCSHIPGPPCAPDSGNARTGAGEGFISIHNGIHGGSDLNPKQLDWRGPVAIVTITRLRGNQDDD